VIWANVIVALGAVASPLETEFKLTYHLAGANVVPFAEVHNPRCRALEIFHLQFVSQQLSFFFQHESTHWHVA